MIKKKKKYVNFFFNDTATTEIYTLSLHDALPILDESSIRLLSLGKDRLSALIAEEKKRRPVTQDMLDRKSTRLNSSHTDISRMPSSA